jgi:hypothetical protein
MKNIVTGVMNRFQTSKAWINEHGDRLIGIIQIGTQKDF